MTSQSVCWFLTGSQGLYGPETLQQVERQSRQIVDQLNAAGVTIVLTTHYLEEAELYCNRIAMLKAGRVVALDSTRNLLARFAGSRTRARVVARGDA